MLAAHGIFSLVDFHQDLYNEKFGGEGWPDWAVLDDGLPANPIGFPTPTSPAPGSTEPSTTSGPTRRAGGVGIQERYAAAWARVAESFKRDRGVLGYDLLNEPWPGTAFAGCPTPPAAPPSTRAPWRRSTAGCCGASAPSTEARCLLRAAGAVQHRRRHEHPKARLPRIGFSFHVYCPRAGERGRRRPAARSSRRSSTTPTRSRARPATRWCSPSTARRTTPRP